jgi:Uma2 family endonuclease
MADNTLQFQWITTLQGNLDLIFKDRPDVLVAGDNLWYPDQNDPSLCQAPDMYVAFGRPKGYRGSYKQWEEGGIAPQVVFEVLSPRNRSAEMMRKFSFYDRFAVEEYYVLDPQRGRAEGFVRGPDGLADLDDLNDFVSPRLGVRFAVTVGDIDLFGPDGKRFLTFVELGERANRLAEKLRELGVDPDRV